MKRNSHTPGPWLTKRINSVDNVEIINSRGDLIGVAAGKEWGYGAIASRAEAKFNAKAMSAAPDLITTLHTLRQCCLEALSGMWDKSDDGFVSMLDDIEEVLTQATGEQFDRDEFPYEHA